MFTRIKSIGAPFWLGASLVALSVLHLLFAIRTNVYFSQDDFAVLAYFKTHSTVKMIGQFLTQGDMWDFRKIVGYLNLRLLFDLWRVNPLAYLINNHLWHTVNVLLVFGLVRRLTASNFKAFFAAALFNKFYLGYFSNIHEYLVTTFNLASLWLFAIRRTGWAMASFVLALLTKEVGAVVPVAMLAIDWRRTRPFWLVLGTYLLYQAKFFSSRFTLTADHPYLADLSGWERVGKYLDLGWVVVLGMGMMMGRRWRQTSWLLAGLAALAPALLLPNRHESYYLYLPTAYLALFLGVALPRLTARTAVVYLVVVVAFGGRQIFPQWAKVNYPNWQKESIRRVVSQVEQGQIKFGPSQLERDAYLMLGSQVVDLFLPASLSAQYRFHYNLDSYDLEMVKR